jgi:hypothetical protein
VLAQDPLAPHLSPKERQSRLVWDFDRSLRAVENCLSQTSNDKSTDELESLKEEALTLRPKLNRSGHPPDSDLVRSGVDLVLKMEKAASDSCGYSSASDRALLLIGLKHNGAQ